MADGMFPDDPPVPAPAAAKSPYLVLARKYRPLSFAQLIGQDAMVQTLRNAFKSGRIHHAFILTGVRGVGKTTTARILARAFNYEDETGRHPTLDFDKEGIHDRAIIEGRHVDVVEMDAASNTGINDIREIIDSVKYGPVSAPYKVYIIDEVHMLSTAAFNGLLKTLEEPPEHVKFIFATTEIRKVPITVLSRCQRFDLRRIAPPGPPTSRASSRSRTPPSSWSPARRKARRATRSPSSTRRSPIRRERWRPRPSARCSASPTGRWSSTSSRRSCAATSPAHWRG